MLRTFLAKVQRNLSQHCATSTGIEIPTSVIASSDLMIAMRNFSCWSMSHSVDSTPPNSAIPKAPSSPLEVLCYLSDHVCYNYFQFDSRHFRYRSLCNSAVTFSPVQSRFFCGYYNLKFIWDNVRRRLNPLWLNLDTNLAKPYQFYYGVIL
jgi:hypothetical protein